MGDYLKSQKLWQHATGIVTQFLQHLLLLNFSSRAYRMKHMTKSRASWGGGLAPTFLLIWGQLLSCYAFEYLKI